jgi:hypothetical protein
MNMDTNEYQKEMERAAALEAAGEYADAAQVRAWAEQDREAESARRLIAAAPDLLAALRNMLCEVRMSADTENRLARLTIEHAEKAIAKAEGRAE